MKIIYILNVKEIIINTYTRYDMTRALGIFIVGHLILFKVLGWF